MRLAFHPAACLFWVRGDTLASRTSEDYAAGFNGRPAPDEAPAVPAPHGAGSGIAHR